MGLCQVPEMAKLIHEKRSRTSASLETSRAADERQTLCMLISTCFHAVSNSLRIPWVFILFPCSPSRGLFSRHPPGHAGYELALLAQRGCRWKQARKASCRQEKSLPCYSFIPMFFRSRNGCPKKSVQVYPKISLLYESGSISAFSFAVPVHARASVSTAPCPLRSAA